MGCNETPTMKGNIMTEQVYEITETPAAQTEEDNGSYVPIAIGLVAGIAASFGFHAIAERRRNRRQKKAEVAETTEKPAEA